MKYLPPGTLTKARRRARLEGALAATLAIALLGVVLVAATPREFYTSAQASPTPRPQEPYRHERHALPPCTDMHAKDCMQDPIPIPEPGTASLIGAALAGALYTSRRTK